MPITKIERSLELGTVIRRASGDQVTLQQLTHQGNHEGAELYLIDEDEKAMIAQAPIGSRFKLTITLDDEPYRRPIAPEKYVVNQRVAASLSSSVSGGTQMVR